MDKEFAALEGWVAQQFGCSPQAVRLIAGDASPRRYYRVSVAVAANSSWPASVIAVRSPATENNDAFLKVGELFRGLNVRTPEVFAYSLEQGFFLLEDFGDELLLSHLRQSGGDACYGKSLDILMRLSGLRAADLPSYDATRLQVELDVFPEWFVTRLLDLPLDELSTASFSTLSRALIQSALEQPRVLVHRDFHSRNLMLLPEGDIGVIDYQDAVMGPITYDLVSLLKDCYIRWPRRQQLAWLNGHFDKLKTRDTSEMSILQGFSPAERSPRENEPPVDITFQVFSRWFDLLGLQRHLKVLGVFARLNLRDHKPAYLNDLPLVTEYVREVLALYAPEDRVIAEFQDWFEAVVMPRVRNQPWYREPESIGWQP